MYGDSVAAKRVQPHEGEVTSLTKWWGQLHDPELVAFVQSAQNSSPTMGQARARIAQARASARVDTAGTYPSAKARGEYNASKTSSPYGGSALDASWELDFLGKHELTRQASAARLSAANAAWHQARVSLAAEVAGIYFNYRYCSLTTKLESEGLESRLKTLDLVRLKVHAGATARTALYQVEAGVAEARNGILAQEGSCQQLMHQLSELTTVPFGEVKARLESSPDVLPSPGAVPFIEMPVAVLRQRPDLAEAEQDVYAAAAEAGVAEARRYPSVKLFGSIGLNHDSSDGFSSVWSWGPSISLPVLDGGRTKQQAVKALAEYDESVHTWKATVQKAVREVEDSLIRMKVALAQVESADFALSRYDEVFRSTEVRYDLGAASLLELEDARRSALSAKQSRLALNLAHAQARVALYKAAGGGWPTEMTLEPENVQAE